MSKYSSMSIIGIDAAGALIAAGLIGTVIWYVSGPQMTSLKEVETRSQALRQLRSELAEISATLDSRRQDLGVLEDRLQREGAMPSRTPVESDLGTLNELLRKNNVRVARIVPLPRQEYPGLLELRYSCEAVGRMPDVLAFLRDLERNPFWTDVSYLSIKESQPSPGADEDLQAVAFAISLFSSGLEPSSAAALPATSRPLLPEAAPPIARP